MKLTLNLATRRYLNMRLLNASLLGAFLLLGGLLLFNVRQVAYNQAELGRLKNLVATGGSSRPGQPTVTPEQMKALEAKIGSANAVIARKSVNWLSLLDRLEEVVPDGVALTQLEPSQREQLLKVNGVARTFSNLRALLENMERSKNFSEVYLLAQSETKVGLTQKGISFSITCKVNR